MKNIVLCSDGTGNIAIKARGTNVFKLYEAVDIQGHKFDPQLAPQVAFYDDGVGTSRFLPLKLIGGAFGWGFTQNVKDLYKELVHAYEPGDNIYLFGFSRGAYTVRTLAGLIQYCGVVDANGLTEAEIEEHVDVCWAAFRDTAFTREKVEAGRQTRVPDKEDRETAGNRHRKLGAVIDDERAAYGEVNISFIGVWDTVGALGVPSETLRNWINRLYPLRFAELTLGPQVKRGCHALSIDDERRTFHPELWNEQNGKDRRIYQLWFAGVHSNVGGGYPKHGMSLVSLDWMMTEAEKEGLRFIDTDRDYVRAHQDVHDKLYDSRAGIAVYYRWNPRNIVALCRKYAMAQPKIHVSVFERIANGTDGYAPGNIPFDCEVATTDATWPSSAALTDIGKQLRESQKGNATSPLERMAGVIRGGKWAYNVILADTIVSLVLICWSPDFLAMKGSLGGWQWNLPPSSVTVILFLLMGLIALGWSVHLDRRLSSDYARAWNIHRRRLRNLLRNKE